MHTPAYIHPKCHNHACITIWKICPIFVPISQDIGSHFGFVAAILNLSPAYWIPLSIYSQAYIQPTFQACTTNWKIIPIFWTYLSCYRQPSWIFAAILNISIVSWVHRFIHNQTYIHTKFHACITIWKIWPKCWTYLLHYKAKFDNIRITNCCGHLSHILCRISLKEFTSQKHEPHCSVL